MIKEVTYYQVVCDEPDCGTCTADLGDYSAWGDSGDALDQWRDHDGQVVEAEHRAYLTYCEKHRKPECADCGAIYDLTEYGGDQWCPSHLASAMEQP